MASAKNARIISVIGLLSLTAFAAPPISIYWAKIPSVICVALALEACVVGWKELSIARLFVRRSWSAILDGLCLVLVLFKLTFFLEVILTLGGSILMSRFLAWVSRTTSGPG